MPNDPGDPDATDEENIAPDAAEATAANAAEAQGVDEDDDLITTEPDPVVDGESEPTEEALLDVESDEVIVEEAADTDGADAGEDLEASLAERTEDLQRVSAEYANYRRRTERERAAVIDNAKASLVTELLPVLDDLDLAKQHGDLDDGPLKAVTEKLRDALKGQKLAEFGAEGDEFDPEIHEAVQDLSSGEDKKVGTVLRKGYYLGDKLIRNAMVIIADPSGSEDAS